MLAGYVLHQPDRRPMGNRFGRIVPARFLLCTKIRPVENLLQTNGLRARFCSLPNILEVLINLCLLDLRQQRI